MLQLRGVAISAMLDRLREPRLPARDILLNFDLVVRSSCGAPKKEKRRD